MAKNDLGLIHDSFVTALANPSTTYVEIPTMDGSLGLHIRWADGTSAATITLESTNELPNVVASDSVTAGDWVDEGVTITGPTASAAGASIINIGNIGASRIRLKIAATAVTKLRVRANWRKE